MPSGGRPVGGGAREPMNDGGVTTVSIVHPASDIRLAIYFMYGCGVVIYLGCGVDIPVPHHRGRLGGLPPGAGAAVGAGLRGGGRGQQEGGPRPQPPPSPPPAPGRHGGAGGAGGRIKPPCITHRGSSCGHRKKNRTTQRSFSLSLSQSSVSVMVMLHLPLSFRGLFCREDFEVLQGMLGAFIRAFGWFGLRVGVSAGLLHYIRRDHRAQGEQKIFRGPVWGY